MSEAITKKVKRRRKLKSEEIETVPDAWERFEKTIGKIVPPKRPKPKKETGAD